MTSSTSRIWTA